MTEGDLKFNGEILRNEVESFYNGKNQSSGSCKSGGLSEETLPQTSLSRNQPNYKLDLADRTIGNIISSLVYLSPMKTFWRIVKKRSTEDFSCIPYVCTLLNGTLWVYYGIIKPNSFLVATVNGFGAVTQIVYILIFLTFASPRLRAKTAIQFGILDVGFGAAIILFTKFMFQGDVRIDVAGFICVGSTMIAYGSPLAVMKTVIATKSVEYMPFLLSFAILLNGGVWTFYAVLAKDYFLGVPNGIGFLLGIAQLVLYAIYHRHKPLKKVSDNLEDGLQNESLIPASDPVS